MKLIFERPTNVFITSPTNVRGSHPFRVGLTEEVQRQGNPRRGKKYIKHGFIHPSQKCPPKKQNLKELFHVLNSSYYYWKYILVCVPDFFHLLRKFINLILWGWVESVAILYQVISHCFNISEESGTNLKYLSTVLNYRMVWKWDFSWMNTWQI